MKEDLTRRKFLNFAKENGFEFELRLLFDKFDRMLKACTNDKERADIAKLGCVEVYKMINNGRIGGDFFINGEHIIKEDKKGIL